MGVTVEKLMLWRAVKEVANTGQKEDNFVWALERCYDLLKCQDNPDAVVTNRDHAPMNVVDKDFSKLTDFLCRFHITMNVKANCKAKCKVKEDTKEKGKPKANEFPNFVEYVEGTILGSVKEKVVRAWTDCVMHLGNTTTNRIESTHARLKKYVANSLRDICKN
ncbi:protein FAR1-RELATED SEQUENCE 6 [Trifolium medium]|uniref:Protein FAR1-RELATED SEQUENCE 6 n=1 Tax=Trifolium medium TaxID=97028 RepID=A0A392M5R4_9FABA|nr:protein FAR1-RELATED SEQUENCE 6 [Trifolium medium]